ncbi:MAG: ABC transporter permease [Streptosporangiaceae bacterium]
MTLSRLTRVALTAAVIVALIIIYVPLFVVVVNSFNADKAFGWPPTDLTLEWWRRAASNLGLRSAIWTSVKAAVAATALALTLGTMASFAAQRYRFFGRGGVSLLVVLPIALPGIVTGIALNNAFNTLLSPLGLGLGLFTVIVGHSTFCIVVVFNNVQARLRRVGTGLEEASMDLGADTFTTFRYVTLPVLRSALLAGGLLAFALSFDEIIVTTFTAGAGTVTLPIWIFQNLFRPNQAPIVNVVAALLIVVSIVPIYIAQRLSGDTSGGGRL